MPEWLIERGIGETRAVLVEDGRIIEARIELDDSVHAGTVLDAQLVDVGRNGRNAVVQDASGASYLLPRGAPGVTQGGRARVKVTREKIPGAEPWKRPLARVSERDVCSPPPLVGRTVAFPPAGRDELAEAGWADLLEEASSGEVGFDGGRLRISPTPAMTLIDVDGWLAPEDLAAAGAAASAEAIRRLDIGGSIGIDLPTVKGKAERQRAGEAIDKVLSLPFERTAMNGFGFVQVVRPRLRPSLVEIMADRASAQARALLRRAAIERKGAARLVAHPAVIAVLEQNSDWTEALSRQVGGAITLRSDPSLPIHDAYAESV